MHVLESTHTNKQEDVMIDNETCWQAVLERDTRKDGSFVYAVRSTGIFCRPSCPSRRPLRANVEFFAVSNEARLAGFRPCQRCRPTERDAQVALIQQICHELDTVEDTAPTLAELGQRFAISPAHLQRLFTRIVGVSPRTYLQARRAGRLREELRSSPDVTTAIYEAGYSSSGRAYEETPVRLGMTPGTFRQGGAGVTVEYATAQTPLGQLLVAATPRGVCFVALGDDDTVLHQSLARELPAATRSDNPQLAEWLATVVAHLDGRRPHLDLPLDVRATAFQEQVWRALQAIPRGETRSYAEVAKAIGKPGAAQAVGQACGSNPTALIVPCHRVVREDGALGGYRWGIERKQALLAAERIKG
jgi:AraC family transcriptional regulator, regulatory protein of adaptative response / methylated-DNA-[protein]-cysteine methyltransferase